MHEFCSCFHPIINAYQEKLREVKALRNTIKVWKQKSEAWKEKSQAWEKKSVDQTQKIKELKRGVTMLTKKLASKVCDDCGEQRITEQLSSMSVQENTSESKVMMKSLENRTVCHFHSSW